MAKFITQKQYYKQVAEKWNLRSDPSRPGREDIQIYNKLVRKALGRRKNQKVVILGATPEIRDMLYSFYFTHNVKVICVDWLPEMYYGMSQLINHRIPNEKFVRKNWLEMDFSKKSIDIFIGDWIVGNIPRREEKEKLFNLIRQQLKPTGYFIIRHAYITPRAKINDIKKHLYSLTWNVLNENLTIKQAATSFYVDLLLSSWFKDKENKVSLVYYSSELEKINSYFKKKNLSKHEIVAKLVFQHFLKLETKKFWVYYTKKEEGEILRKFFVIKETMFSKNHHHCSSNAPIYFLKPRK